MRKTFAILAILVGGYIPASEAQGLPDQNNFLNSNFEGIHLYGVSAFLGYNAYDFPQRLSTTPTIDSRTTYGGSATAGWQRFHGRTNVSARYTASFNGDSRYSELT